MTTHDHGGHYEPTHSHGHGHVDEDMLSVEQAYDRVMASFQSLGSEEKLLLACMGQVLAEDIKSPLALPPLANSGMDGYALRHSDIAGASHENPRNLEVIGIVAAGHMPDKTVGPGTAIRIMTGAPVPDGADTVVPFEETDEVDRKREGKPLNQVAIFADMPTGCNVRPAGEDISAGTLVLEKGIVVRAAEVGVIASLGMDRVKVIRRPVVAVLATGDELETAGMPLPAGKIYDSNSFSVAASVVDAGGIPKILGIARDNLADLTAKLAATSEADLVVTSAGVSKGDYDIVKDVLNQQGEMNFWSVRMRPAKPLAFGHLNGPAGKSIPLMGLPGNPVSAMVAFEMFARPAIRTMLGKAKMRRPMVDGVLTAPIRNEDGRRVYARVEVEFKDGRYQATPTGPQGSNILTSMSKANGLAICPEDLTGKDAGEQVQIIMLDWNEEVQI
ncbi:MAG: gephyrin-like molybdotransferase Glp [Chloroflexota bacterium]|nr:gephyrin-like molybdotransferase Glp [Chloroflexota bacterium]